MIDIIQTIWSVISKLPSFVTLLLLPFTAIITSRAWISFNQPSEKIDQRIEIKPIILILILLFAAFDWELLMMLPRLGLSFGPVGLPLLGITIVRSFLTLLLIWLWQIGKKFLPDKGSQFSLYTYVFITVLVGQLFVLLMEVWGMCFEPFNVQVTELEVKNSTPVENGTLHIVQISDLHIERLTKREKQTLELINDLEPDIIVITGDYLNTSYTYDSVAHQEARDFLSELDAPYGVYAVLASPVDPPEVVNTLFDESDIVVLNDEFKCLSIEGQDLYLVGVTYTEYLERERDEATLSNLMQQIPPEAYTILLYHTPDIFEAAAEEGINLYLAGHTHGGQVRLPLHGAIITASEFGKRYEHGRYKKDETILYVNRGLGMEGQGAPRVRFLCSPEIVSISLIPSNR